jgi:uncharacterized integral membrane protein
MIVAGSSESRSRCYYTLSASLLLLLLLLLLLAFSNKAAAHLRFFDANHCEKVAYCIFEYVYTWSICVLGNK